MYKVFVNEQLLFLTSKVSKETQGKIYLLKHVKLKRIIKQLHAKKSTLVTLYHPKEDLLLKTFKSKIPVVKASGGLVVNDKKQVLVIKRNGVWDLPKGGLDKGETIQQAAIREIEEETAVKDLSIQSYLCQTHHIFKRQGRYKLKQTDWFLLSSNYEGELKGQENEGIEEVKWVDLNKVQSYIDSSYENIKIVHHHFKKHT